VVNENLAFRLFEALRRHASITRIDADYEAVMKILGHTMKYYDLGHLPMVWSHRGRCDLAEKFLEQQGMLTEMHWCDKGFDRTCHLH
jgi:hypothetical protein